MTGSIAELTLPRVIFPSVAKRVMCVFLGKSTKDGIEQFGADTEGGLGALE